MDAFPIAPWLRLTDLTGETTVPGRPNTERLNDLKRDISRQEYSVDAREIADAILRKARLVKEARVVIDGKNGDRTHSADELRPPRD